jgi:hypothetical protein
MLEDATAQNLRLRQLLQRVSTDAAEVAAVQASFARVLGAPCVPPLSEAILDALNHDPCAITGATRRMRGWHAVEDIHRRVGWQRAALAAFVRTARAELGVSHAPGRVYALAVTAKDVADELGVVKLLQSDVKARYNETVARVSVVYPEVAFRVLGLHHSSDASLPQLTQIAVLEESHRDQYQHLWEFGMDALTFMLDAITPVWRTYGKR